MLAEKMPIIIIDMAAGFHFEKFPTLRRSSLFLVRMSLLSQVVFFGLVRLNFLIHVIFVFWARLFFCLGQVIFIFFVRSFSFFKLTSFFGLVILIFGEKKFFYFQVLENLEHFSNSGLFRLNTVDTGIYWTQFRFF